MAPASQFGTTKMALIVRGERMISNGTPSNDYRGMLRAYAANKTGTVTIVPTSQKPTGFLDWKVS